MGHDDQAPVVTWRRGRNHFSGATVQLGTYGAEHFAITHHKITGIQLWKADAEGNLGGCLSSGLVSVEGAKRVCARKLRWRGF